MSVSGESAGSGYVRAVGDGAATVRLDGRDVEYTARCVATDHGPAVVALTVATDNGRPLTPADLRATPLRRIARAVAGVVPLPGGPPGGSSSVDWSALAPPEPRESGRGRPPVLTDADYRRVADLAREAYGAARTQRRYIADALGVSLRTVDNRLREAKRRGYIGDLRRTPASAARAADADTRIAQEAVEVGKYIADREPVDGPTVEVADAFDLGGEFAPVDADEHARMVAEARAAGLMDDERKEDTQR